MKSLFYFAVIAILVSALGCNQPLVPPNQTMGSATRHGRAAMVKNPDAAEERIEEDPQMSSTTADGVLENYKTNQKTQEQQKRRKVFGIDVDY